MSSSRKKQSQGKGKEKDTILYRMSEKKHERFPYAFVMEPLSNNNSAVVDNPLSVPTTTPTQRSNFGDALQTVSPYQGSCVTDQRSGKRKVHVNPFQDITNKKKTTRPLNDITNGLYSKRSGNANHFYPYVLESSPLSMSADKENQIIGSVRNLDVEFSAVHSRGKKPIQLPISLPLVNQSLNNGNEGSSNVSNVADEDVSLDEEAENNVPWEPTIEPPYNNTFITESTGSSLLIDDVVTYPSYHDMGDPIWECSHCKAVFWYDERIEKSKKTKAPPLYNNCCMHGKIQLPRMKAPPQDYKELLYGTTKNSKKFQNEIRFFNMIFSFTSMGGKVDNSFNTGTSAPNFRLNGENSHLMGTLMPSRGTNKPAFAQLYIYDTENEVRNRITAARKLPVVDSDAKEEEEKELKLHTDIVGELKKILDTHNLLVHAFRASGEELRKNPKLDIKLRLVCKRTSDGKLYNLPQASEVAVLIVGDIENLQDGRDIIVKKSNGELRRINELHTAYLPLQYPLLFLYGEDGFRDDVPHCETARSNEKTEKMVTMKEYISYRLHERADETPHLLFGRRLLQQFIVDAYTMVESFRIRYMRTHQKEFRCDSYAALDDALNKGDLDASTTEKRIILPSSFVGGARYMIQNYHDAMCICRWVGYPNLFITFTCNANWREIRKYVQKRGLSPTDRPDIVSRVFHAKLDNMLRDIRQGKLFGETSAVVYTIEFQKRGLPHAHILLFIKDLTEGACANVVDGLISAEIPDAVDSEYHDAVNEFMIHGPCGLANTKSPCMDGNRCTKHFPKKFVERTSLDNDGFVVYRRRDDGRRVVKNGIELDNRYVVPHNRYLLTKYRAHINVEWCNRARSIKYLFKYVHKGHDRATAVFYQSHDPENVGEKVIDEIKQYFDCRYISASEAAWRLFGYEIHFKEPNVVRLGIHLPGEQSVIFNPQSNMTEVLERLSSKESMLTMWMVANTKYSEARSLTYAEFPMKFVWNDSAKEWRPRQRGLSFGRLPYIYTGCGDLYYLRILLNVVRGCTSFADISTYDGKQYKTFKEACYARGLLDDDKEYVDAIKEAANWGTEAMLLNLFVNMLTSDSLTSPNKVWDDCKEYLAENVLSKYRERTKRPDITLSDDERYNMCLQDIEEIMKRKGRSLLEYPSMPYPEDVNRLHINQLIVDELAYNVDSLRVEHENLLKMLNDEQRLAYDTIMDSIDNGIGQVYFLYGYGGTGKTFVWKTLSAAVRSRGKIVLNVASSGIASLLLPGGRTAHSKFAIPLILTDESMCGIKLRTNLAELIVHTDMVIWDEAPMMHRNCFEALDRTMRDIMRVEIPGAENLPFGGKVVVFGGDFRQILPVIPKGTRPVIVHATINSSKVWKDCKVLRLTKNMRLQNVGDQNDLAMLRDFSNWMSNIGDGTLGDDNDGEVEIEIPDEYLITQSENYIESIVQATYPSFHEHIGNEDFLQGRAILAPTLDEVYSINNYMVSMHTTDEKIYLSSDSIALTDRGVNMFEQMHTVEFLNTIRCSGVPNHELKLKVGVPIMLLRNIDPSAGLCNGTRLVVTKLGNYVIKAKVLGGKNAGDLVFIPRITLTPSDAKFPFTFQRRQFPIMISYAMTINKSQGQSLSKVGIFLKKPVFTHGQLYVAVSRVTTRAGLKLLLCDDSGKLTNRTKNVVYKEVFQNL